jgi:uncharacterized protein DUF6335
MARRKTPRAARRGPVPKGNRIRRPRRAAASARKKSATRKLGLRKATGKRKASARLRKAKATHAHLRKATARQARVRKGTARRKASRKVSAASRKTTGSRKAVAPTAARTNFVARKAPSLDRERRTVRDDEVVPTPPSSLDLDRSASAARSGRRELHERFVEHTETSPAITGGDIDADWESAYSVGDEAPGGDNPTPDQDVVDDIGRALGVQYEDNEELKGEAKIADRDRKRWELDPASSEDYKDR